MTKVTKLDKNKKDVKIVFMGTPEFAAESLEAIIKEGYDVKLVLSQPDRKKGRGMKLIETPVKECALKYGIEVYQPEKLRGNEEAINKLKAVDADLFIVVAYGKILKNDILSMPKYGCINVHGSLLPKYRGAAPIQYSIIKGEEETGITTMFMDEGIDTGDMLCKASIKIDSEDTYETLHDKLKVLGADVLVETLNKYLEGSLTAEKQGDDYTLASMIDKEMCKLNFNNNAQDIKNLVRGVNPFPCSYMILDDDRRYKVFNVNVLKDINVENYENGEVIKANYKEGLIIKANDYAVEICMFQEQNGKRMSPKDYLKGKEIKVGAKVI